jgi:hypothetical protein
MTPYSGKREPPPRTNVDGATDDKLLTDDTDRRAIANSKIAPDQHVYLAARTGFEPVPPPRECRDQSPRSVTQGSRSLPDCLIPSIGILSADKLLTARNPSVAETLGGPSAKMTGATEGRQ